MGERRVEGVDTDLLPCFLPGGDRPLDGVHDLRVALLPDEAHRGGEVRGTDEDPVDTRRRCDRFGVLDGFGGLNLDEQ